MKILQGNKFDLADRLFFNLSDSFRCAMEDVSDVRELTPELYYLPEIFININKEDFGKR
jgi:Beige/BEACH domain